MVQVLKSKVVAAAIISEGLKDYVGGTFVPNSGKYDHGVVVIGYSKWRGFKARNSWGSGEDYFGIIYLHEDSGVCNFAMYPILLHEHKNPKTCASA